MPGLSASILYGSDRCEMVSPGGGMTLLSRPKSLTELAYSEIRSQIVSGTLALGEQVSEAGLAKDLGVSRTPVREALNRLEKDGLVHVEAQRGTFIFSLAPFQLAKLCDARVCLETAALVAAMTEQPAALKAALSRVVDEMGGARASGDDTRYLTLDTAFHQALMDCAGNDFLNDAYQVIAPKMAAIRNRLGGHRGHMAKSFDDHCKLADIAGDGDIETAQSILRTHIGRKEGSYWKLATLEVADVSSGKSSRAL